jgi:glycosyltransferase involved in cell wall biosynthesis
MTNVVCIPAFNEEKVIGNVIRECLCYCDSVIVCDDGSSDNTSQNAQQAGAKVIRHNKNKGKGASLKTLFQNALENDAEIIITMDGDGQFLPKEIPKLITTITDNDFDIVVGYRFDSNSEMPKYRQVGNQFLDKITNLASDLPLRDTQSGFRVYSKKAIEKISFDSDGFAADSEILVDATQKGLKIGEVQVTVLYNIGSKTSTKNPVSHTVSVLLSLIELIALKRPLTFVGIPGIALALIGIYFLITVISLFNETRYFSVPSTLLSIGSLVTGLMLLMMSVVLFSITKIRK